MTNKFLLKFMLVFTVTTLVTAEDNATGDNSNNLPHEHNSTQNANYTPSRFDELQEHSIDNPNQGLDDPTLYLNSSNISNTNLSEAGLALAKSTNESYVLSTNPQLVTTYITSDIVQSARENLQLRQYFLNIKSKFDILLKKLQTDEEELATTNKTLGIFEEDTYERLENVKQYKNESFEDINQNIGDLNTKFDLLKETVNEHNSQNQESLKKLQSSSDSSGSSISKLLKIFMKAESKVEKAKIPEPKCNGTEKST